MLASDAKSFFKNPQSRSVEDSIQLPAVGDCQAHHTGTKYSHVDRKIPLIKFHNWEEVLLFQYTFLVHRIAVQLNKYCVYTLRYHNNYNNHHIYFVSINNSQ